MYVTEHAEIEEREFPTKSSFPQSGKTFVVGPKKAREFGHEENVSLSGLRTTQTGLDPMVVRKFFLNPRATAERGSDMPIIIRQNGTDYIGDGHHRLEAAKMRGERSVKAMVVKLDAEGKLE